MATNDEIISMCSATQADVRNICNTLDNIKEFIGKQSDQITQTMIDVAVIKSTQNSMKEVQGNIQNSIDSYTATCTKERTEMGDRIKSTENFQKNQLKAAGVAGGFVAFLIGGGIKILDKLFS